MTAEILLTGDATEVLEALRQAAVRKNVPLLDDRQSDDGALASIVVIVVRETGRMSAITHGLRAVDEVRPRLADDAITIVVTVKGLPKMAPQKLLRWLVPEILHEVRSAAATTTAEARRPWRNARLRFGEAVLTGLGVGVFRVA